MSPTSFNNYKCDPEIKVFHGISMLFKAPWKTKVMSYFSTLLHGFLRSCRRASVTQALTPQSPVFLGWKWCEMMFLLHSESAKIQFLIRRAKHGPAISAHSWPRIYTKKTMFLRFAIWWFWFLACISGLEQKLLPQFGAAASKHVAKWALLPCSQSIWQKGVCTPLEALYKHVIFLQTNGKYKYSQSKPAYTHLGAKDPPRMYHTDGTSQGVTMSPPTVRTQTTLRAYEESKTLQDPQIPI